MNDQGETSGFGDLLIEMPGWMQVFIVIVATLAALIFVLAIVSMVKNWVALRRAGIDPLAAQGELAGK